MRREDAPGEGVLPRVGVVVTQLGYGGAERQTFELLRLLKGTPWQPVAVYCLSADLEPYGPALQDLGYRVQVLPRWSSFDPGRLLALRRGLRRDRVTVVHAVHLLASAYAWLSTRGFRQVSILPTMRATEVQPGPLRAALYRRMFASVPHALANSFSGASFLIERFGAAPDRVTIVPNGLDFERIRHEMRAGTLRREIGVDADVPIVGFVGKDSPVKNAPRFLEIVRRLRHVRPDVQAVLVGRSLGESARSRLAPDLPRTAVHFLGPRNDVPALLADATVLIVTSESEGCPNVVLEALAVGTPVVSADVGDVRRMIPPGAGVAVPKADLDRYIDAILRILSCPEAARREVRAHWPALEKAYGLEAMTSSTVRMWQLASAN